ncbi:hypothetical protein BDV26DRAFT_294507 [Aspergillus bertholletiae]|uniref:Uncharacterized protein n=1 Tax=Aspergillus bertholletiae TaxID=1226010 RepID=A0A5N7B3P7_9EURO|nr:hypothetical protein BDV26DRAFT_294507 [Aspergillus bertholletiae]
MSSRISFTKKRRWSTRMEDQERLANAKKNLSSLHTFTFNFLKNKASSRAKYKDSCVEVLRSDEERIASMLVSATHTQLDLHEQPGSDEEQDRPLTSSSGNTTSTGNICASPSSPITPPLVHSELGLSTTEPFPDYYESCERNMAVIDKDLEEAYSNAIAKVFEESVRMKNLGTNIPTTVSPLAAHMGCPVTTDSLPRQADSNISLTSRSAPYNDSSCHSPCNTVPTSLPHISSATSVHADLDKSASMTSASQASIPPEDIGVHSSKVPNVTLAISNGFSIRDCAYGVVPISTSVPQSMADGKTDVQIKHIPSVSSSSTRNDSSERALGQPSPMSHMVSDTCDTRIRNDQNNQYYALGFHSSQPALSWKTGSCTASQTFFTPLQSSMPLSGSICSSQTPKRTLSIDEMAMANELPTPNFHPPIGTGRPLPGAAPKPAHNTQVQCHLHEAEEQKLNILEEMKIILRADNMKDDIQRRFTAMTNIILRMEWILFRRDVKPDGTRTKEFLSALVVGEVEELAIPMVQYLSWLDKKLASELSISQQVLYWIMQIAKDHNLGIYQRFRQMARVIIRNLRKPHPLEKQLLSVFQGLYDTYVYSNFLNTRNRQILREDGFHIERDNLTRLLIAGWDVLSRTIENYNEVITINIDIKSRFVDPIMERLPRSYEIWEEEWDASQWQCEIQRNIDLENLLVEAEERVYAGTQKQELSRAQARMIAELRDQMQWPRQKQGFRQQHIDFCIPV